MTLIVDAATRRDVPAGPVQVRVQARAENVPDLSHWQRAAVTATAELGDSLRIRAHAPSLCPLVTTGELTGTADLGSLAAFARPGPTPADPARAWALHGTADVTGRASYHPDNGFRVPEFVVRLVDLTLASGAAHVSPAGEG